MELRGSRGNGGNCRGGGNIKKYEHFKHIIGQRADALEHGVTEEEVLAWVFFVV